MCDERPCENEGICIPDGSTSRFYCMCKPGTEGPICQVATGGAPFSSKRVIFQLQILQYEPHNVVLSLEKKSNIELMYILMIYMFDIIQKLPTYDTDDINDIGSPDL